MVGGREVHTKSFQEYQKQTKLKWKLNLNLRLCWMLSWWFEKKVEKDREQDESEVLIAAVSVCANEESNHCQDVLSGTATPHTRSKTKVCPVFCVSPCRAHISPASTLCLGF